MSFLNTVAAVSFLAVSAGASASLHSFDVSPYTGGALGNNQIENISTTYDSDNERFTWSTELDTHSEVDGFWLVVNNGPNPRSSSVNELAIMYGDLRKGVLTTYVYNGENSANSISDPAIWLQTDTLAMVGNTFSFDISTVAINKYDSPDKDYTGVAFDEKIGIWFHYSTGSNFSYNSNGDINAYSFLKQGYYDVANLHATTLEVSAPALLGLFGLGFAGLTLLRRKTQ